MPYELTNLELEEISLVDKGANQHAKVTIIKRKEFEQMTDAEFQELHKMCEEDMKKINALMEKGMTREEAMAAMRDEMKKSLEEVTANLEKALADAEELKKALDNNGFDVSVTDGVTSVAKRAEPEMIVIDGEPIEKSAIPAPILKKLIEVEKAAEVALIEKAANEVLPNAPGTAEVRGKLVQTCKALGDEFTALLLAADKLFAGLTEEAGAVSKNDDATDPAEKLTNMAKVHAEATKQSFAKAYDDLLMYNPDAKKLYNEIRNSK